MFVVWIYLFIYGFRVSDFFIDVFRIVIYFLFY